MKGKLYLGSIDVSKIDKSKLFTGKKGTYLNLSIWVNNEPDNYGNHMSIQQSTKKDEDKIYLGNGKEFEVKPHDITPESEAAAKEAVSPDDLPF